MPASANNSHDSDSEHHMKVAFGKHSFYTHFPKDRICEVCKRTKIPRVPCRRRNGEPVPRAETFGDLITGDHEVPSEDCESRNNHRYSIVVEALATQWIQSYPCKTKTSEETERSSRKFCEPSEKPKVIDTVMSLKFGKSCEDSSWNHRTSTPYRSETNGIAERAEGSTSSQTHGGKTGLPARVSGCHVVRGRQSSPIPECAQVTSKACETVKIQETGRRAHPGQDRRLLGVGHIQGLSERLLDPGWGSGFFSWPWGRYRLGHWPVVQSRRSETAQCTIRPT